MAIQLLDAVPHSLQIKNSTCLRMWSVAPQVGLEPTTTRLTAECSAIELLRNIGYGKELSVLPRFLFLNPATSYSPGPFPAKYHQRAEA